MYINFFFLIRYIKFWPEVLANRLKRVMDKLITASPNTFVGGRQILDLVFIAMSVWDKNSYPLHYVSWI